MSGGVPVIVSDPPGQISHWVWPAAPWNVPAAQGSHAAALERPVCALNVPAAQAVHDDAPGALYVPGSAQVAHAAALERPVCALYVPAAQGSGGAPFPGQKCPAAQVVHADAPGDALYVPASQFVHVVSAAVVAPAWPYLPAAHVVPVHALWPAFAAYVPAAQISHALWPIAVWRHPAGQLVHVASAAVVAPPGPNVPAAHVVPVHDVALVQPAPLCRPAGQSAQVLHMSP